MDEIDPERLVIMGHSMGGWVTALTDAQDKNLLGAAMISAVKPLAADRFSARRKGHHLIFTPSGTGAAGPPRRC